MGEKLISAEAAEQAIVKALVDCMIKHKGLHEVSDAVLDALHSVPAVDAVPVVRCKHCVYGEPCKWPAESDRYYCTHPQSESYYRGKTQGTFVLSHEKNHYCDFGKQRENAE